MKIADGFTGQRFLAMPLQAIERLESNPLTYGLYIFALGHFPKAHYHYVERTAGCGEYILLYCTDGAGWVEIDHRKMQLNGGEFIIIPKGAPHLYHSDGEQTWSLYWVHFRGTAAEGMSRGLDTPHVIAAMDDSRIDERNTLFDEIYNILNESPTPEAQEYANMLFMHYMATFRHLSLYRHAQVRGAGANYSDTLVRKAMHYMYEHLESHLSIDDIAALCGYSKSYVYRKFIKEVGEAPIDYFIRIKINRACFLLLHSDMSISQIALKLDFSESQYFARTFKKVMGMSATAYRKQGG